MQSIFTDKKRQPTDAELREALGKTYSYWKALVDYTNEAYPGANETWNFPGAKYGWSFRISDKKRVLIYLLPRDKFFKVAFVFGQKATDEILGSDVSGHIKTELKNAKVYAEGRGIRIEVKDKKLLKDLQTLISVKLRH